MSNARPQHAPAHQDARYRVGAPPAVSATVAVGYRPVAPPASRIEQRPVVLDRWGRTTLAGLGDDRTQIQATSTSGTPVVCAVLGFLLASALAR